MEQIEFFEIPSPCIGVCQANQKGYCLGCYRSREERFNWNSLTLAQKHKVVKLCQQRKRRHKQKLSASKGAQRGTLGSQGELDF